MNGAIIRIRDGKDRGESKNKLIAMLEVLLSSTKKKEKMQQLGGFGLKMTTELEGSVSDMCNISEAILERGLEEGIEKNQLDNIAKLMKKLKLTEEEAMDMLDIDEENRNRYHKLLSEKN